MPHPDQSINPYHKAPTLKMESVDVPLIDRMTEKGRSGEESVVERERKNREAGTVCGK